MVSTLDFGSSGPGSITGWVSVFFGKTLLSWCLSLPKSINEYWQILLSGQLDKNAGDLPVMV